MSLLFILLLQNRDCVRRISVAHGMFHNDLIANLPLSLSVEELWKSVNIWRSYRQKYSGMFFLTHSVEETVEWIVMLFCKYLRYQYSNCIVRACQEYLCFKLPSPLLYYWNVARTRTLPIWAYNLIDLYYITRIKRTCRQLTYDNTYTMR